MCVCVSWQHTLETALLSASQELREQSVCSTSTTSSTLMQQKEVLQSGLLSTCRELSRVSAVRGSSASISQASVSCASSDSGLFLQEVDRCWREYDKLSADVTLAKSDLLEELEALGSPQVRRRSHWCLPHHYCHNQSHAVALTRATASVAESPSPSHQQVAALYPFCFKSRK